MIYDTLRKIPYLTFIDIALNGDLRLLTDEPERKDEELLAVWLKLEADFSNGKRGSDNGRNRIFNLEKEIEYLINKYNIIKMSCDALLFDKSPELIAMLRNFGYRLRDDENYAHDIERVLRESEGIVLKINNFKKQLPPPPDPAEDEEDELNSIIELMACYSAILGFDFDYNTISVVKFWSLEKQVKQKVKAAEKKIQSKKK